MYSICVDFKIYTYTIHNIYKMTYVNSVNVGISTVYNLTVKYDITSVVLLSESVAISYEVNLYSSTDLIVKQLSQEQKIISGQDYVDYVASTLKGDMDSYVTNNLPLYSS
jgi:hypothetical protein